MPEANAAVQEDAAAIGRLSRERDEAVFRAAVETVRAYAPQAQAALELFLAWEAKFRSIAAALDAKRRGQDTDQVTMSCAQQIREILAEARKSAGVERDQVSGPRLLDRLTTGQEARL